MKRDEQAGLPRARRVETGWRRALARAIGGAGAAAGPAGRRIAHATALGAFAALTLAMFVGVLFAPEPLVLSNRQTDLFHQFVPWREFGFGELRRGNLALWNPHLFCGAPFFGGFQSALLYPPNWLHLALPLAKAINLGIALHVFLAGAFTYAWAVGRGLHPLAGFLSGACFMFGGAYFPHIFAGHLPNLCAMVWAPVIFLALDRWFARFATGALLLGMFAVAMQVLAGHPQYVFYTAIGAALYTGLHLIPPGPRLARLAGAAAMYAGGAALSAVQLVTGLSEAPETLRGQGVPIEFAAMFSFPPENLLTLAAPWFFGALKGAPGYWGRCYLWEMSLFLSVTGLVLALYGAATGERQARRFAPWLTLVFLVLALGAHTPLFSVLYHWAPGFDRFRGNSKFIFLAALFLSLLAGAGLDRLLRGGRVAGGWIGGIVVCGVLLGVGSLYVGEIGSEGDPQGVWARLMDSVWRTGESYLPRAVYGDRRFLLEAGRGASDSLLVAGGTALLVALLLHLAGRARAWVWAMVALALGELWWFARGSLDWFDLRETRAPILQELVADRGGEARILNLVDPNRAMSTGAYELWGYDPGVPRRYAEFIAFTQGLQPDEASQYVTFRQWHRLYAMLRCRAMVVRGADGTVRRLEFADTLPHLLLVQRYRVLQDRAAIFAAMDSPSFDPRQEVILEQAPQPPPAPAGQGMVWLREASTDHLLIEAELSAPALLLITDGYARGWRGRALEGSAQARYTVLPANYCLRAVPLGAGRHRFVLEYEPRGFRVATWVSGAAWFGLALGMVVALTRSRGRKQEASGAVKRVF